MKILGIFSLKICFFILVSLKKAINSVYSFIIFFLIVIDLKVVMKEFLNLKNLKKAQISYIHKFRKIIIVYKDNKFMFKTF